MQHTVSERFYYCVSGLIAIAMEDENDLELEIAMDLIGDITTEE